MTRREGKVAIGIITEWRERGLPARKIDEKLRAVLPRLSSRELDPAWTRAGVQFLAPAFGRG
jgi:hypothetical protein